MMNNLYRGKTLPKEEGCAFNNTWVYGDLIHSSGKYYIHPKCNVVSVKNDIGRLVIMHEVLPETIGMCIGKMDVNGKEIFTGDVVNVRYKTLFPGIPYVVRWNDTLAAVDTVSIDGKWSQFVLCRDGLEIIGNIHDNPEILEVKESED